MIAQFGSAAVPQQTELTQDNASKWAKVYGKKHRLTWIRDFPAGIIPPRRVRIYRAFRALRPAVVGQGRKAEPHANGWTATWWPPSPGPARSTSDWSISGRPAVGVRKTQHILLVERFRADLHHRADAGEIDPRTVQRYGAALKHYQGFVEQPSDPAPVPAHQLRGPEVRLGVDGLPPHGAGPSQRTCPWPVAPDAAAGLRPRRRAGDVLIGRRTPQRGKLIPEGFHNPFLRHGRQWPTAAATVQSASPTSRSTWPSSSSMPAMPTNCVSLAPLRSTGFGPAEPCLLFHEHLDGTGSTFPACRNWATTPRAAAKSGCR